MWFFFLHRAEKNTLNDDGDDDLNNKEDDYQLVLTKHYSCNVDLVTQLVQQYVPGSSMMVNRAGRTIYNLPARQIKSFKSLCSMLSKEKDRLQLTSFEITFPNLGDVYIM